ncbi:MAG: FecR domain-containing protein [Acidobacteriota bacterium]
MSIEGIRRWGLLALFIVLAGALVAGGFFVLHEPPQRRAQRLLQRASVAQEEVRRSGVSEGLSSEFDQASSLLETARHDLARNDYSACAARAEEALRRFELLAGLVNRELVGSGQIVALQGKVEVQRANQTRWETAHEKQRLYNGDFIKTSREGAADILFSDGTVCRVGPNSLLEVHRTGRSERESSGGEVKVKVGQVNVYTTTSPSLVLTDAARAEVDRDSRMGVEVGPDTTTHVSSYSGKARVTGASGERIDLGAQQAVTANAQGKLGKRQAVPDVPALEEPRANAIVNLDTGTRVELRWRPVPGSTGYHLQVSRSRLFAPFNIEVESDRRPQSAAALQVLRPGTYHWRVAALGTESVRSEWSSPRAFKAYSGPRVKELADTTPAKLEVQPAQQIGHFFLVQGVTESGAIVTINGEAVEVGGDGTFKKAVVFGRAGWNTILVRAIDPAGNTSEHRESVLVEVD